MGGGWIRLARWMDFICSVLWMVGFGLVVWINEFGLFWGMYGFWVDVWIDWFGLGVWRIKRIGLVW